jgi:hypothetical protein
MPDPKETVQYCPICRTKTWHVNGVCEWTDGHDKMKEARGRVDPEPRDD